MFPLHDDNPTTRTALVTYALIAINAIVFLYMVMLPPLDRQVFVFDHGFIPARISQLSDPRPLEIAVQVELQDNRTGRVVERAARYELPPAPLGIFASVVTAMFLHGGWMHLIGNMWFLAVFGNNVEDRLGHLPYLVFYLLCGLIAAAGQWALNTKSEIPMIGASGAVAAVLGAYAITYPHARVRTLIFLVIFVTFWDLPAWVVLGFWFVGQVFAARADSVAEVHQSVAFMAHVAGFGSGLLLMVLCRMVIPPPQPRRVYTDGYWEQP